VNVLKFILAPVQKLSPLLLNHATKVYRKWKNQMDLSSQLHALAAKFPGEEALALGPDDGGSKLLHNIRNYLQICGYLIYEQGL
jgi:hypothetical protein